MIGEARRMGTLLILASVSLSLAGCVRGCTSSRPPIHINPNMDWQPRYQAQGESEFFYDGSAMRLPVPGTVARGTLREDTAFYTGKDADGAFLAVGPLELSEAVVARGAERYGIFCRPCHNKRGNGKGVLTERAGVPVPSFSDERLQAVTDGEIFDVITSGKGLMPGYAYPIRPADRWAIISHVRHLQREAQAAEAAEAALVSKR